VENNYLTGVLPPTVANLLLLNILYVGGNQLTGFIPQFPSLCVPPAQICLFDFIPGFHPFLPLCFRK
jgi:hypothetical protein